MKIPAHVRWMLVPFAAIAGCSVTSAAAGALGTGAPVGGLPLDVRVGLVNAGAAAAFVLLGSLVAPRRRLLCAGALFLFGALVAWAVLGGWYFPEGHPRGYQPSRVPLIMTLAGGLLGVGGVAGWRMLSRGSDSSAARSVPEDAGHHAPAA